MPCEPLPYQMSLLLHLVCRAEPASRLDALPSCRHVESALDRSAKLVRTGPDLLTNGFFVSRFERRAAAADGATRTIHVDGGAAAAGGGRRSRPRVGSRAS